MTTQINSNDEFRHISMLRLRQILKAWESRQELDSIGKHGKVQLSGEAVFAIVHEAIDQRLIAHGTPPGYPDTPLSLMLTDRGEAIANATARKRSGKAVGYAVLDKIIQNIEKLNENAHSPVNVERLWVFGSLIDPDRSDIGDVDIAIETSQAGIYGKVAFNIDHYRTHFPELRMGNVNPFWLAPHYFCRRALYGPKRHNLISEVDLRELIDLHVPCALVFDKAVGRLPIDRVLPHHPGSSVRSSRMGDRLEVPKLTEMDGVFRPSSAEILGEHFSNAWVGRYVQVCASSVPADVANKLPNSIDVNGQERFALVFQDDDRAQRPFLVTIDRGLESADDDYWNYRCKVTVSPIGNEPSGGATRVEELLISEAVKLSVGADMHRLAWLRRQVNPLVEIYMDVNVSVDDVEFPGLRAKIQEEAGGLTADRKGILSQSLYYGVMVRDERGIGTGLLHWLDLDEDDIDNLPEDFPISKEEILNHPLYQAQDHAPVPSSPQPN